MPLRAASALVLSLSLLGASIADAAVPLISTTNTTVSQQLTHYLPSKDPNASLINKNEQKKLRNHFRREYFDVWTNAINTASIIRDEREMLHFAYVARLYQFNFQRASKQWLNTIANNMNLNHGHPLNRNAVIVSNTYLRSLPTEQPLFRSHHEAGQGFPFDTLQVSALWVGAPIKVVQLSADKLWALVSTHNVDGWIKTSSLAFASKQFVTEYTKLPLVAITKDRSAISAGNQYNVVSSRIGMLLPKNKQVLIPVRDANFNAHLVKAKLDRNSYQDFPLKLSPSNLARLMQQIQGEPYGWGGFQLFRDCSLTVMDLYLPFGIVLPRNSQAQLTANKYYNLRGLDDDDKLALLKEKGVPFLTLLGTPGHIVIYLGDKNGVPYVFQTVWGADTTDRAGDNGRAILGESAVTRLAFGKGIAHVRYTLLDGLTKMTTAV